MKEVDFLIVGQGIAGTVFCHTAMQAGYSCHVVDVHQETQASKVAGGLINPITGRFLKKSWMMDELLPVLQQTYRSMDAMLQINSLKEISILRLLSGAEEINNWEIKRTEVGYSSYMGELTTIHDKRVRNHPAVGKILNGGWLDTRCLLNSYRTYLKEKEGLTEEIFNWNLHSNHQWKDISFKYLISCEGYAGNMNPYFEDLPLRPAKGQVMIVKIDGPDMNFVLNKNMLLIPLGDQQYKVGATVEHSDDLSFTEAGLAELKEKIESVLDTPYDILIREVGIRPTVKDRRPLLGKSQKAENVFIFNGLGTKGVSLAPYFAQHLLHHIIHQSELMKEVDIQRFKK